MIEILINIPPLSITCLYAEERIEEFNNNQLLLLVLKDSVRIKSNNATYIYSPGDIAIVNPNEKYVIEKSKALLLTIAIDKEVLHLGNEEKCAVFASNPLQADSKDKARIIYQCVLEILKNKNILSHTLILSVTYRIMHELYVKFPGNVSAPFNDTKISKIIEYIDLNYGDNLQLNDIADKFGLSVQYLSKLFKSYTGTTFTEFYDKMRVTRSLYDLAHTQDKIIDIAYKHGFPNNNAYTHAFRKVTKMLPSDFRKKDLLKAMDNVSDNYLLELLDTIQANIPKPSEYKDYQITEDYKAKALMHLERLPSHEILSIGSASIVLHKNIQDLLQQIQSTTPFRYAYIRGIFCDELAFCNRALDGSLAFNFSATDEILDFLHSVNLIPAISFTYMPMVLASKTKNNVPNYGYYACAPSDLGEWKTLIKTFVNHIAHRYNENYIKKCLFLPWSQLDSQNNHVGFDDEESFFEFYKTSYTAVKEISPDIPVSSPEIYPSRNKKWISDFLANAKNQNCLPDMISVRFVSNENWELFEANSNQNISQYKIINGGISGDENLLHGLLTDLKEFLAENGYNLDIYVTSFNFSIDNTHPLREILFSANYYIKNYIDNIELIKSMSYFKLCDDIKATSTEDAFTGGVGMYLQNGIPKSTAIALRLLYHLHPVVTGRGENYLLSATEEQSDNFRLIACNYSHPQLPDREDFSYTGDLYSLFPRKEKKRIKFVMKNVPYLCARLKIFIINTRNGALYEKWEDMGEPKIDFFSERKSTLFEILSSSAMPGFKTCTLPIENNKLTFDFTLDPFEIKMFEIVFS